MTAVLGVDPGRDSGAAVLLTGEAEVAAWWTWCLLSRKDGTFWRLTTSLESEGYGQPLCFAMWDVGREIHDHNAYMPEMDWPVVVVEGLFVPRRRRGQRPVSPQSVIPLAEATGELVGGLRMTPALRPKATEWRHDQLGLRQGTAADRAEEYAVEMAAHKFRWPDVAGLEAPPTKAERGALAEAAFIARYGWVRLCR